MAKNRDFRWIHESQKRADRSFSSSRRRLLRRHPKGTASYDAGMRKISARHARDMERIAQQRGGCAVAALGVLGAAALAALRARGLTP